MIYLALKSEIKTGAILYDTLTQQEIVITLVTYNKKVFFKPNNPFIQYAVWIHFDEALERFKTRVEGVK